VTDPWNPTQYEKFLQEREQPFFDLLTLIRPASNMRVVDLGCGTGKLTRELHTRLAARETVGIDRSQRILDASEAEARAGLRFEPGEIESFPSDGARYDLIFSNAALHWVEHHDALFERLVPPSN
jgi:trans-aconitate 2-methyltransferase